MGDVRRASEMVEQAKGCRATYGPKDDSPQLLQNAIEKYGNLIVEQAARKHTESYRRQFARLMMEQSDALLAWRDYGEAERLANQAESPGNQLRAAGGQPRHAAASGSPSRGDRARRAVAAMPGGRRVRSARRVACREAERLAAGPPARSAYAAGDLAAAEAYARAAIAMQVPESSFAPGEDRPGMVLLDIQKARLGRRRRGGSGRRELRRAAGEGLPPSQAGRARFTTPIRIARARFRRPTNRKHRLSRPPRRTRRRRRHRRRFRARRRGAARRRQRRRDPVPAGRGRA